MNGCKMGVAEEKESENTRYRNCLVEPRVLKLPGLGIPFIEISVHSQPKPWKREFENVASSGGESIKFLLTSQPAQTNLLDMTIEVAKEKDELLEKFLVFAEKLREEILRKQRTDVSLQKQGNISKIWVDYVDPCSGQLRLSKSCQMVFPENAFFEKFRKFNTMAVCAGCRVVLHPKWGPKFYPATFMTTASSEIIVEAIESLSKMYGPNTQSSRLGSKDD